jgi:hypothetical protein
MKTNMIIITAIFLLGFLIIPNISKAETSSFKSAISESVKYPSFASKKGLEAIILIQMAVAEDGTIAIEQTNQSCCQEFLDKVLKQLDGQKIKRFSSEMVGIHYVKLVFNIE